MLTRLSTPDGLAVPLADLKVRIRVDHDDDDDMLTALIKSETQRYEDFSGRFMLPISLEYRQATWGDPIILPATPVREVTAVKYLDSDHAEQTIDGDDWYLELTGSGAEIRVTETFYSPSLSTRANPVRVEFSAGYDDPDASGSGDEPELVAEDIDRTHIMMMVQRVYDMDDQMTFDEMRQKMGHRRIFR